MAHIMHSHAALPRKIGSFWHDNQCRQTRSQIVFLYPEQHRDGDGDGSKHIPDVRPLVYTSQGSSRPLAARGGD